jgi:endonuclease-3 related protein
MAIDVAPLLQECYRCLLKYWGRQSWWPADTPFEVMVGAVLTQNTRWHNVEMAIAQLDGAQAMSPQGLLALSSERLQQLIRSAGFFRQKSRALHDLAATIVDDYGGEVSAFLNGDLPAVRRRLLQQRGVGPETADSILLYAAGYPSFVVDAYARRVFQRVGLLEGHETYVDVQRLFMDHLPTDPILYSEFHALLVRLAKNCCLARHPACVNCPLLSCCQYGMAGD